MWELPDQLAAAVGMAPFVAGLVEVARRSGLAEQWLTLVAMGIGLVIAVLFAAAEWASMDLENLAATVLVGIAAGLMGSGILTATKELRGNTEVVETPTPAKDGDGPLVRRV